MSQRGQWKYWLLALGLIGLALLYADSRNLQERFWDHQLDAKELKVREKEITDLETEVEQAKAKLEQLDKDPVEIEANVRKINGQVRDGEIIFRVEDVNSKVQPSPR